MNNKILSLSLKKSDQWINDLSSGMIEKVAELKIRHKEDNEIVVLLTQVDAAIGRYFNSPLNRTLFPKFTPQFKAEFIKSVNEYDIGKSSDDTNVLTDKAKAFISQLGTHVPLVNDRVKQLKEFIKIATEKGIQGFLDEINHRIEADKEAGYGFYNITKSKDAVEIYTAYFEQLNNIPMELMETFPGIHDIGLWFVPVDEKGVQVTTWHPYAADSKLKELENNGIHIFSLDKFGKETMDFVNNDSLLLNRLQVLNARGHLGLTSPALGENSVIFMLFVGAEEYAKPIAANPKLAKAFPQMLAIMAACDVSSVTKQGFFTPEIAKAYLSFERMIGTILRAVKDNSLPKLQYNEGRIVFSEVNANAILSWLHAQWPDLAREYDLKTRLDLCAKNTTESEDPARQPGTIYSWVKRSYEAMGLVDFKKTLEPFFNNMLAGEFLRAFIQHIVLAGADSNEDFFKTPTEDSISKDGVRFLLQLAKSINDLKASGQLEGMYAFKPTGEIRTQGYDYRLALLVKHLVKNQKEWANFFENYITLEDAPEFGTKRVIVDIIKWLKDNLKEEELIPPKQP